SFWVGRNPRGHQKPGNLWHIWQTAESAKSPKKRTHYSFEFLGLDNSALYPRSSLHGFDRLPQHSQIRRSRCAPPNEAATRRTPVVAKKNTAFRDVFSAEIVRKFALESRSNNMWMGSCAACKALLHKLRLCDSVRCQCGWTW